MKNEQKIRKKFDFFEDDLDNDNIEIEREVVNAIAKNENLPIEIDEEFKNQTFRQKWKLKKMRNRPDMEDLFIDNVN